MFDLMQYALIFYDFQLILARMGVSPTEHRLAIRDNHGVAHVRRNGTIAHEVLVTRGAHSGHLFASLRGPRQTGYASEAIEITMCCITQERGIQ